MAFLGPVLGALSSVATTLAPIVSVAGTIASMATGSGKKGGGGATAQQATSAAAISEEDIETKRRRALAMQKQMGRGGTLLTSGSDYAPASTVGGALRSTFGGT
jgi:hypothetical protein